MKINKFKNKKFRNLDRTQRGFKGGKHRKVRIIHTSALDLIRYRMVSLFRLIGQETLTTDLDRVRI